MRRLMPLLFALGAALPAAAQPSRPGDFDYYILSLSWSPDYCASRGDSDPAQCAAGRRLGFVLHGLWPQYDYKKFPSNCSEEKLPDALRKRYAGMYPSPKLIGHEWEKHGTCSGLGPEGYLALSAKLHDGLKIPAPYQRPVKPLRVDTAGLVQAFQAANPGMQPSSVLPFCSGSGRFLRELRVCYARDGSSRSCSSPEVRRSRKSCGQETFLLQSVR
ncbi:ribonuclease T2 family protein [Massilia sp. SM-13]|uniref:ribonuclease T2 family protein n=1 Tax=Pseudoduganella rhizocola TaxID=3382643 RepID=UPI0038B5CA97